MPSEREKIAELIELALDPYWSGLRREPSLTEVEWRVVIAALRAQDREDGARLTVIPEAVHALRRRYEAFDMEAAQAECRDAEVGHWSGVKAALVALGLWSEALPLSTRTEDGDANDRETIRQLEEELGIKGTAAVFREALRRARTASAQAHADLEGGSDA